jgi:AraC-like DNA-binding protein
MSRPQASVPAARTAVARLHLSCGELDALQASHFAQRFPPHFHDTFAIGVVESGATILRTPRGVWAGREQTILAFSPSEIHSASPVDSDGWTYRMFYPSADLVREMGIDIQSLSADRPLFSAPVIQDAQIARDLLLAHEPLMAGKSNGLVEDILVSAFRRLAKHHGARRAAPGDHRPVDARIVRLAREYMDEHFDQRVRIQMLADLCGISEFHVIRVFRRFVGVSPYAYLIQLRVNRAQALLCQGAGVADVAYACGFSDQSHLTRTFKKAVGVPPGQYVRSVAESAA